MRQKGPNPLTGFRYRGVDVNVAGASDRRPIHRAAGANSVEVVTYLIQRGADVNIAVGLLPPLLVLLLLSSPPFSLEWSVAPSVLGTERAASNVKQDKQGRTALHWAAISGHVDSAALLFDAGADPLLLNSSAEMPIHCAAEANRPLFVKALLDRFPDKKEAMFAAKTEEQKTACDLALANKFKEVVAALKEAGDPAAASAACVIS
eukprot:scaffold1696_cov258-Pinguiococcus_pyrenoidosus.AAC.5